MFEKSSMTVRYTACDWLTATGDQTTDIGDAYSIRRKIVDILDADRDPRNPTKSSVVEWMGYFGDQIGSSFVGQGGMRLIRPYIVRCSGPDAMVWCKELPSGWRPSRIDFQVTAELLEKSDLAESVYEKCSKASQLIRSADGGSTCYINKRTGDNFGRIYDKGVESGSSDPGMVWRFEVELKRAYAVSAYEEFRALNCSNEASYSIVRTWFGARGVWLPPVGTSLVDIKPPVKESTDEGTLAWIENAVAPCIWRMVDSGHAPAIEEMLGLRPGTFEKAKRDLLKNTR